MKKVNTSREFLLVKKKDKDEYRMILDLSDLNKDYVEYKKSKMDTLKSILRMITPDCWFYSIDFSDAYYSIPIHPRLRKYLRFELDGKLYQYMFVLACQMAIRMHRDCSQSF